MYNTAKEIAKTFSALDPDTPIWCVWLEPKDFVDDIDNAEVEKDEHGNFFTIDDLTEPLFQEVTNRIDSDDYLWDRFGETARENLVDVVNEYVKEKTEATTDDELWKD